MPAFSYVRGVYCYLSGIFLFLFLFLSRNDAMDECVHAFKEVNLENWHVCALCSDTMEEPVTYRCGHSVCRECIKDQIDAFELCVFGIGSAGFFENSYTSLLSCGLCRVPHGLFLKEQPPLSDFIEMETKKFKVVPYGRDSHKIDPQISDSNPA